MDCAIGIRGNGFVLLLSDMTCARSVVAFKHDDIKAYDLDQSKVLVSTGDQSSRSSFAEFIQKNMALMELRGGHRLSCHATAHYIRKELATAIRSREGAYQANVLFGGLDADGQSNLYHFDYLGSMAKLDYSAHGYCGYFAFATLDRHWKPNLTLQEAQDLVDMIIQQLRTRFLINLPKFYLKIVTKDGITEQILG